MSKCQTQHVFAKAMLNGGTSEAASVLSSRRLSRDRRVAEPRSESVSACIKMQVTGCPAADCFYCYQAVVRIGTDAAGASRIGEEKRVGMQKGKRTANGKQQDATERECAQRTVVPCYTVSSIPLYPLFRVN